MDRSVTIRGGFLKRKATLTEVIELEADKMPSGWNVKSKMIPDKEEEVRKLEKKSLWLKEKVTQFVPMKDVAAEAVGDPLGNWPRSDDFEMRWASAERQYCRRR